MKHSKTLSLLLESGDDFLQLLAQAKGAGYRLILGCFCAKSSNVYRVMALCKNPKAWDPMEGSASRDTVALWWFFDDEATGDYEGGRKVYPPKFDSVSDDDAADEFDGLPDNVQQEVLERLRGVPGGKVPQSDAPRSDV